ncbi:MAG TPA: hypothetical protein VGQ07_06150, partial [Nitrospirales bacterium]|nr:hypothetical protein [Nitrospirales bacterium]
MDKAFSFKKFTFFKRILHYNIAELRGVKVRETTKARVFSPVGAAPRGRLAMGTHRGCAPTRTAALRSAR